jgi:hypothetical protein
MVTGIVSETGVAPLGGSVSSGAGAAVVFAVAVAVVAVAAGFLAAVCADAAPGSVKQRRAVRASRFMRVT